MVSNENVPQLVRDALNCMQQATADFFLLNAFAGPDEVYCSSLATETGWHDFSGAWSSDQVDLEAYGLDISANCNLPSQRDPIPIDAIAGAPGTTTGTNVLHNDTESSATWPVLCAEPDGWSP